MKSQAFLHLRDWLFEDAFPLWSTTGLDLSHGGFIELLDGSGAVLPRPLRARLVGRQIYAFSIAARLGWAGPAREVVRHGLDYLLSEVVRDGKVTPLSPRDGTAAVEGFDLYDQAFVLFGMAAAASLGEATQELSHVARGILAEMRSGYSHPFAGFEECRPRTLPLKANPHMHMLEASLAWCEVSDPDGVWDALADEIVGLCLTHFLDPKTGALREYFDGDWRLIDDDAHDVVEPGHQSEWAWLLIRWGLRKQRPDAVAAGRRLIEIAENHGVSAQDLAVNELGPDLSVRSDLHRLWPQTERIKAFVALGWVATDEAERQHARHKMEAAAKGLLRYTHRPVRGGWWEHLDASGQPLDEPIRASSLYHITCAVMEMTRATP